MKAITPEECKEKALPDFVIKSVNKCIQENYRKDSFVIYQDDLVKEIIKHIDSDESYNIKKQMIFNNHWLDIEETYREAGWEVEYNKPGYNEGYPAYFKFSKAIKLYDL